MAEIEMERRPRRNAWTWVILVVVLAAVAFGAWLAFGGDIDVGAGGGSETTVVPEPVTEPATPLQERPEPQGPIQDQEGDPSPGATPSQPAPPPDGGGGEAGSGG